MAKKDVVERLRNVPIFAGCSKKELEAIANAVREVTHKAGAVVAAEGEPGAGLFIIDQGEADVTIGGKKVNHMSAGDFFGEMALLDGGPRSASVVAETPLVTIRIERAAFRRMLKDEPDIALKLLEGMARRMRTLLASPEL
jgi:CRP/FNR family transcriptional regulator, cyclic AMP receptor protein